MKLLFPVFFLGGLLTTVVPISAGGQECGYSINTIYVADTSGNLIRKLRMEVTRKDPHDEYNPHFSEPTKVYWNDERKAHVYQHGLCGQHRDLVLRVSSDGFDTIAEPFELNFGSYGFGVTLKRKGTNEEAVFKKLTCDGTNLCVRTINYNQ